MSISAMDISTSALVAQRARLNAISSNIANMSTIRNEDGENVPYQGRFVVFETNEDMQTSGGGVGVRVSSVETSDVPPVVRHLPGHPLADENGNVLYPKIDMNREFVDALGATRAYEANIGVMEVSKNMASQTLRILA